MVFFARLALLALGLLLAASTAASPTARRAFPRFATRHRAIARRNETASPCAALFEFNEQQLFDASEVSACMQTVPFNSSVATQLVQYYRDLVVFQSTLAYLKQPPPSYQQPGADLLGDLDLIQRAIDANAFANEYDFETSMLRVVHSAHDGHLSLSAGVSSIVGFGLGNAVSSLSEDGLQPPRPYLTSDVYEAPPYGNGPPASPIVSINGQDAIEWLTQFAADNTFGLLDPHADWNALMETPAGDVQGLPPVLNGATVFNPGDSLEFILENGTVVPDMWLTLINVPFDTPELANGQEVYNYFVLGIDPEDDIDGSSASATGEAAASTAVASAQASSITATASIDFAAFTTTASATATPTNWYEATGIEGYPDDPIVYQANLGNGGSMTGYFLADDSVAVLSIPSFDMTDHEVTTFSYTAGAFIQQSQAAGKTKIVIDLQQNYGGNYLLAADIFKQFFPRHDPFTGSRMRSFESTNALGLTFTQLASARDASNETLRNELTNLPWAVLDYTDAQTEEPFLSWPEYFGPHADHGDLFSTVQRDNLSNTLFDEIATGGLDFFTGEPLGISIYGYGNRTNVSPQPFAAENMVLLTDGICSSACAVFVEMMHHEAGVRTVAVGGRPSIGPMQAVGGTRGAQEYDAYSLDNDIARAVYYNASSTNQLPGSHLTEPAILVSTASFNLRDQIRQNENFPLQFAYEAASCRIYWTKETVGNFAALWQYTVDALWGNSGKCVADSTIFANSNATNTLGPSASQLAKWNSYGSPTRTPILPSDCPIPSPASLLEGPDGQIYSTSTPSAVAAAPPSKAQEEAENISEPDPDTLWDDTYGISSTLNQECTSNSGCTVTNNEKCVATSICRGGRITTLHFCKKRCEASKECGSKSGFASACDLSDLLCRNVKGKETCTYLTSQCSGTCNRKNTLGRSSSKQVIQNQRSGFCRSAQPLDKQCAALEENPTLQQLERAGFAYTGGDQVLELNLNGMPDEEDQDPDKVSLPGVAARIVDSIMRAFHS